MLPPELDYYARIGAFLFPLVPGTKDPFKDFKWTEEASADPAAWRQWQQTEPGCNSAMLAGKSGLIVIDIDVKEIGRDRAWAEYEQLCKSWGVETMMPAVSTPSGGWHIYTKVPPGTTNLTNRRLVKPAGCKKAVIETRAGNGYVVIPPSKIGEVQYGTYHS